MKTDIILLHGALGSAAQLEILSGKLLENFNVHALNFSGHGGNPVPADGFRLELFENDVLRYMDSAQISSSHFFGYSMGGYVALSLSGKYPDRVKSVFTLATKFNWSPETALQETAMLNPDTTIQKVPKFANLLSERHAPADWKEIMKLTAGFMMQLGSHHLDDDFFKSIDLPVRLSVGDRDKMVSIPSTLAVYVLLKNGSLLVLPETPHPVEACDQDRLADEITRFCRKV